MLEPLEPLTLLFCAEISRSSIKMLLVACRSMGLTVVKGAVKKLSSASGKNAPAPEGASMMPEARGSGEGECECGYEYLDGATVAVVQDMRGRRVRCLECRGGSKVARLQEVRWKVEGAR